MENEKTEETIENQEAEETPDEETSKEEQATSEKPEKSDSEEKAKTDKLYARMKKAEAEAKIAKEELEKYKKASIGEKTPIDVFDLAKTVSALRDYSVDELGDIQMIAKAKGISPEEAVKTEEAQLIITARREKVAKDNATPPPSGAILGGFKIKTQEELAKIMDKPGEVKAYFEAFAKHKKRIRESKLNGNDKRLIYGNF